MHPRIYAQSHPDKPALIMAETGETVTYADLETLANQGAQLIRSLGIQKGDIIALWARNSTEFMSVYWAAQRAGVYICPLPVYLSVDDAAYILKDCGAKMLIVSSEIRAAEDFITQANALLPNLTNIFALHQSVANLDNWETIISEMAETPIDDEEAGWHLIYSSGTTGRPKGVKLPLIGGPVIEDNLSLIHI